MEILLAIAVVVVVGALIYFNRSSKGLDVNNDGKVDAADAKAAVQNAVEGVKATADVNNDGKVDAADAKMAVEKAKTVAKKAGTKAKIAAKKATSRGRKPKA
jgi:1,2-phenylacetyl-CoA epoxidase PaaB subunit